MVHSEPFGPGPRHRVFERPFGCRDQDTPGSIGNLVWQVTLDKPGNSVNNVEITELDQVDRDSTPNDGDPDPNDPTGGEDDETGAPIVPRAPAPAPAMGPWGILVAGGGLLAIARRRFRRY